ncbi:Lipoprotein [Cupriavidus sp. H19C3]
MLLALLASLLSACAANGPATEPDPQVVTRTRVVDTGCDWTKPILVSKSDVLSDDTAKAILAHNVAGAKVCGWKPKGK